MKLYEHFSLEEKIRTQVSYYKFWCFSLFKLRQFADETDALYTTAYWVTFPGGLGFGLHVPSVITNFLEGT